MKMRIKVDELCFVNGNLGTWDVESKTWVGSRRGIQEYVIEHNLGTLETVVFGGNGKIEVSPLTPVQVLELENYIGRMKIAKSQAVALLENKVFCGDF